MNLKPVLSLLVAAAAVAPVTALTPSEWRSQSIYQVMTDRFARTDLSTDAHCDTSEQVYCGGTWQGLISELDYIQGMGFTAIWISPFVEQMEGLTVDGSSYHGYWAQNIYAVNSAFGTSDDLYDLSAALHERGMYLMLDVVTNHFAYKGCGDCVDYSLFVPFDSESYFHDFCLIDYDNDTSVQVCWAGDNIVSLPDLRTEDSDVLDIWIDWIQDVVADYNIDGIRLDSAMSLDFNFTPQFEAASGVYILGEVFNGNPNVVTPYQQYMSGLMNYPMYYYITEAFESTSATVANLVDGINWMKEQATDTSLYGMFLENHDNPRFASLTNDTSLAKNAIAFTMLMDGIPIVYQGQEQRYTGGGTPYNREAIWLSGYNTTAELYTWIADLNTIRSWAISVDPTYLDYNAYSIHSDSNTIAMRKGFTGGQIVSVYSNYGSNGSATLALAAEDTGFTAGQTLVDVMSCTAFKATSNGDLGVTIGKGLPRVLYPESVLSGSPFCLKANFTTSVVTTATVNIPIATTTAERCTVTSVAITFEELVPTPKNGSTVKIVGNVAALGFWDTDDALAMSISGYTAGSGYNSSSGYNSGSGFNSSSGYNSGSGFNSSSAYNSSSTLWHTTVNLTPKTVLKYKHIIVDSSETVTWEADPNHTMTVPCATATVSSKWQT